MDLILKRNRFCVDGIFGVLMDEIEDIHAVTLEHAYHIGQGVFAPKLPEGEYVCKRGPHRLASMTENFETFEVMGVPGHTGILFHVGNYNKDSSGCILVGSEVISNMVICSKVAFANFLKLQSDVNEFKLVVVNENPNL